MQVTAGDGTELILDAGTGIRQLGPELVSRCTSLHILLTHLHLDHIQGLPFFAPLRSPDAEVHLWGPPDDVPLGRRLAAYLSPPLFPVTLDEFPADVHLHDVPAGAWELGPAKIRAEFVLHQGPTLGFRLEESGAVCAYIPDHEPALESDLHSRRPTAPSGLGLAKNADTAQNTRRS